MTQRKSSWMKVVMGWGCGDVVAGPHRRRGLCARVLQQGVLAVPKVRGEASGRVLWVLAGRLHQEDRAEEVPRQVADPLVPAPVAYSEAT